MGLSGNGLLCAERSFRYAGGFCLFRRLLSLHSIGVILDWVHGHFPVNAHGLARFDGTGLYEHPDPRPKGFEWIDCLHSEHTVVAFMRCGEGEQPLIFVCNFTPVRGRVIGSDWRIPGHIAKCSMAMRRSIGAAAWAMAVR